MFYIYNKLNYMVSVEWKGIAEWYMGGRNWEAREHEEVKAIVSGSKLNPLSGFGY